MKAGAGVQPSKTNLHGASSKWHSQHEVMLPVIRTRFAAAWRSIITRCLFVTRHRLLPPASIHYPLGRRQELPLRLHLRVCRPRGGQRLRSKGQLERTRHKAQVRAAGLASGAARAVGFRGVAVARGRRSILFGWRFEAAVICERRRRRWCSRRGQHDRQLCAPSL